MKIEYVSGHVSYQMQALKINEVTRGGIYLYLPFVSHLVLRLTFYSVFIQHPVQWSTDAYL